MELLVSGNKFDNYTVDSVLSNSYDYRTVYRVIRKEGGPAVLIVYDMDAYKGNVTSLFGMEVPDEFYFAYRLQKVVSPEVYDVGENSSHGRLCWMCQEFVYGLTLNMYNNMGVSGETKDQLQMVLKLSTKMRLFHEILPHHAHYNIIPENIIITVDDNQKRYPVVIGLGHVDKDGSTSRKHPENSNGLIFKPVEMFTGKYSLSCDVFSLAAIYCEMLTGELPWDGSSWVKQVSFNQSKLYLKALREQRLCLELPDNIKEVLYKALDTKSKRYADTCIFDVELRKALGEELPEDEPDENLHRIPLTNDDFGSMDSDEDEMDEDEMIGCDGGHPRTRAKMKKKKGAGFASVAGMEQLKNDLTQNFLNVLRYPDMASAYGIKPPNGMLLYGPPGCGKTYIASRLAEEADVSVSFVRPSDLGSTYIHGSQSMIADLFKKAEKNAPSILVFDEIDALVPSRAIVSDNAGYSGEVNEFLTQLESCSQRGIFVVGTTNRIEQIDPAVLRTGRIEEMVYVPLPDRANRLALFKMELKDKPCHADIDYEHLVDLTERFTMSDVSYAVKKACRMAFDKAVTEGMGMLSKIDMELLEKAISETTPSVGLKAEKEYERQRQEYDGRKRVMTPETHTIGFRASR